MPLSAVDFFNEQATVLVPTRSGPLEVRYRPHAMTPQREIELAREAKESEAFAEEGMIGLFCEVVSWMDVVGPLYDPAQTDEAGYPLQVVGEGDHVPVAPEFVRLLPSKVMESVFAAIQKDMAVGADGPKPSATSRNGSLSRASR